MLSSIFTALGRLFGDEIPPPETGDPLDFESGPFLDCAISWVHTFKKLLIPKEYRMKVGNIRCVAVCDKNKQRCRT
ncbi:hypothetical protein GWI33_005974 [Rhynchophorus ferrugineus]|uniref:Uncharacterized protein n=1 Tax=Rhynchophorus ferrugineus TaxID=354439 RepID=A0A834J3H7_RHYFE|nr:hypothetical protein GWI33_005974 [Rhynchophorus ferrugineus]